MSLFRLLLVSLMVAIALGGVSRSRAEPPAPPRPTATVESTVASVSPAASTATKPGAALAAPVHPKWTATEPTADEMAQSLIVLAQKMNERGDRDAAEMAFDEILDSAASPLLKQQALIAFAALLKQTGRDARAASTYEKFLERFPNSELAPNVLVSLGQTLRDMGAFKLALARFYAVLNSTLALSPKNLDEYRNIAQVAKFEIAETYYQQGDYATAEKFFGRIKLLDLPSEERARATFREAYSGYLGIQLEETVPALRAFIARFPADPAVQEARYLLCMSLRRLGRTQEALSETLDLLRVAQATAAADRARWAFWQRKTGNQLANDFYEQGDFHAALAVYKALVDLSSDPAWRWPALYQVGLCYERLRQTDRAGTAYRAIIEEAAATEKAGPSTGAASADVRRMAEWRLGQLEWAASVDTAFRALVPVRRARG